MSKILKNTTNSDINLDVGLLVPANGQITVGQLDYDEAAASDDIMVLISNGNFIVNDGSYDLNISEGIDLIKGIFPRTIEVSIAESARFDYPVMDPSKARVDWDGNKVDLPRVYETREIIYNYSGSGELHNFILDFNNQAVEVRLTVDGHVIFDINCSTLHDATSNDDWDGIPGDGWFKWSRERKAFAFNPRYPIKFESTVVIESRSNSNSNKRDMNRYFVHLLKD